MSIPVLSLLTPALAGPVELHGVARVGVRAEAEGVRPTVELARLQLALDPDAPVRGMLQVEGRSGAVELLDARMDLGGERGATLVAGRFVVPIVAEMGQAAPALALRGRALLTDFAPTRAVGAMLGWRGEAGTVALGAFEATHGAPEAGLLLVAAGDFEPFAHTRVHVGGGIWEPPGGSLDALGDAAPRFDRQLDLGLTWEPGRTRVHLEGAAAHTTDPAGGAGGVRAVFAQGVSVRGPWWLQPAVGYDLFVVDTAIHEGSAAITLWRGDRELGLSLVQRARRETGWTHRTSIALQLWM